MLTVVIPSYNHFHYVLNCIDAALNLSVPKEIIVIDDGSSDGSQKLIAEYIRHNDLDIIYLEKENSGLVSSLNLGLELAKFSYIYFCASDDCLIEEGIAKCVHTLKENPKYAFVIGGGYTFIEGEKTMKEVYGQRHRRFFGKPVDVLRQDLFLDYPSPILLQSSVFRVDALKSVGGWESDLILDDYSMFIKLLIRFSIENGEFDFLPDIKVVMYRLHSENSHKDIYRQFIMVSEVINRFAPLELKKSVFLKAASQYVLSGILNKKFKDCFRIFQYVGVMRAPSLFFYFVKGFVVKSIKKLFVY